MTKRLTNPRPHTNKPKPNQTTMVAGSPQHFGALEVNDSFIHEDALFRKIEPVTSPRYKDGEVCECVRIMEFDGGRCYPMPSGTIVDPVEVEFEIKSPARMVNTAKPLNARVPDMNWRCWLGLHKRSASKAHIRHEDPFEFYCERCGLLLGQCDGIEREVSANAPSPQLRRGGAPLYPGDVPPMPDPPSLEDFLREGGLPGARPKPPPRPKVTPPKKEYTVSDSCQAAEDEFFKDSEDTQETRFERNAYGNGWQACLVNMGYPPFPSAGSVRINRKAIPIAEVDAFCEELKLEAGVVRDTES